MDTSAQRRIPEKLLSLYKSIQVSSRQLDRIPRDKTTQLPFPQEKILMPAALSYSNAPDLASDDYVVLGLATCFLKADGEVTQVEVIEPIPSAAIEALFKGIPTSYKMAVGVTLGQVLDGENLKKPAGFPEDAHFGDDFLLRIFSAARTYKRKETAKSLIPEGTSYTEFKYSLERKRVLNTVRVVTNEDNVKQHSHTHKVL
jgi:hypothetical protein